MSNGYAPYSLTKGFVSPMGLETMPLVYSSGSGSPIVVSGSDGAASARNAASNPDYNSWLWTPQMWLDAFTKGLGNVASSVPALLPVSGAMSLSNPDTRAKQAQAAGGFASKYKNVIGSVILVILGLIIFAKALPMLTGGTEKAQRLVATFARKDEAAA